MGKFLCVNACTPLSSNFYKIPMKLESKHRHSLYNSCFFFLFLRFLFPASLKRPLLLMSRLLHSKFFFFVSGIFHHPEYIKEEKNPTSRDAHGSQRSNRGGLLPPEPQLSPRTTPVRHTRRAFGSNARGLGTEPKAPTRHNQPSFVWFSILFLG